MSSNKFLTILSGVKTLVTAIATRIDAATSGNKVLMTRSDGYIDNSFIPPGVGGETNISVVASEALAAGDFVNIYSNAGTRNVRKADASNGRAAHGFVLTAVASSGTGSVTLRGENTALTGLVIGTTYFLSSTTAGSVTTTAPNATGNIIQELGYGLSTTSIPFEYDGFIQIS